MNRSTNCLCIAAAALVADGLCAQATPVRVLQAGTKARAEDVMANFNDLYALFGALQPLRPLANALSVTGQNVTTAESLIVGRELYVSNDPNTVAVDPAVQLYLDGFDDFLHIVAVSGPLGTRGAGIILHTGLPGASSTDTLRLEADGRILAFGNVQARGGAPGAHNLANNGFSFHSNGDSDSGLFSTRDGEVALYSNSSEVLRVHANAARLLTGHSLEFGEANEAGISSVGLRRVNVPEATHLQFILGTVNQAQADLQVGQLGATGLFLPGVTITSSGISSPSDRALKTDIEPLAGSLDRLLSLQGVQFHYLPDATANDPAELQRGFVAQDVERVFPEWVTESDGHKMVGAPGLAFEALTVEAMRELRAENEALRRRVGELESVQQELAALRAAVAELQQHR